MAGDADLQESAMLRNRLTGKEQEVDVVIRSQPAGHEVIVSIEATDRGRKADVQWVQQMVGKHADLPTSKLVLVSSAGFTSDARTAAVENGAAALAVEDLDADDPDQAVLQALHSLWPRHITVTAQQVQLLVRTPAGETCGIEVPLTSSVHLRDGTAVGTMHDVIAACAEGGDFAPLMEHMSGFSQDAERAFVIRLESLAIRRNGRDQPLYVPAIQGDAATSMVEKVQVGGHAAVQVAEIPLQGKRLGHIAYAYGEATLGSRLALAVVTRGKVTLRLVDDADVHQPPPSSSTFPDESPASTTGNKTGNKLSETERH